MARVSERRKSARTTGRSRHGHQDGGRVFITERSSPAPTRCRPSNRTEAIVRISLSRSSWAPAVRAPTPLVAASTRHIIAIPRARLGRVRGNLALLRSLLERALPLQPPYRVIG